MDYNMRIVIDANMIIAALVRDSKAREIIMRDKFEFASPDFVLNEIYKYENEICEKAGLSKTEFELLMALIFQKISIINADYYENYKENAKEIMKEAVRRECRRRRYSDRTVKTYIYCINRFLKFAGTPVNRISKIDIRLFLEFLSEKELSGNTMNVYHMAIRFLFEDILDKRIWIDIKYSKVPERLPVVLSKEEVKKLFNVIKNPKHKLMIQLMYSAGLRVSELINLKIDDIQLDKNYGYVRQGKGSKDRLFIVANSLKNELRKFIGSKKLNEYGWLFTSKKGRKYSVGSLQQIIKKARKRAEIEKRVSCHTLRHSFATHLIEDGYSVSEVQSLLGHKSPETTFVYLHTASPNMIKIKSPLDSL